MLEGVKKHRSDSDVSGYGRGKEGAGGLVERELVFLDGVGWMGFAGTKGGELDAGLVYLDLGANGVASATSKGGGTCTWGLMAYRRDTR